MSVCCFELSTLFLNINCRGVWWQGGFCYFGKDIGGGGILWDVCLKQCVAPMEGVEECGVASTIHYAVFKYLPPRNSPTSYKLTP